MQYTAAVRSALSRLAFSAVAEERSLALSVDHVVPSSQASTRSTGSRGHLKVGVVSSVKTGPDAKHGTTVVRRPSSAAELEVPQLEPPSSALSEALFGVFAEGVGPAARPALQM